MSELGTVVCPKCDLETTPGVLRCHRCGRSLGGRTLRSVVVLILVVGIFMCVLSAAGVGAWGLKSGAFLRLTLVPGAPLPAVLEAARHADPEVREDALRLLRSGYMDKDEATEALLHALGDPVEDVRQQARWGLQARKPEHVVSRLLEQLRRDDPNRRRSALRTLWLMKKGPDYGPLVSRAAATLLDDPDAGVREYAVRVLGGADPSEAFRVALESCLGDAEPKVRSAAASALGRFKEAAADSAPALVALLSADPDARVRQWTASSLGRIEAQPEQVVPALVAALGDAEFKVRRSATQALGRFGEEARSAGPRIAKLLTEDEATVRLRAGLALAEIGASDQLPALVAALAAEKEAKVRAALHMSRAQLDPSAMAESVRELITILGDADSDARQRAASCLGKLEADALTAAPKLIEVLKSDKEGWVRGSAATALAKLGDSPETVDALIKALGDKNSFVVSQAAAALGAVRANAAVAPLTKLLERDDDERLVTVVREALEAIAKEPDSETGD